MTRLDTRASRGVSIGTKLAVATALLIALASAGAYFALSRSLAQTLFTSKGEAAEEVGLLFAANVSAAVVFEDQDVVAEGLKHLAKNEDVTFAAVWSAGRDTPGKELGRYARAGHGQRSRVVMGNAPRLAWAPDVLSLSVPIHDESGKVIAHGLIEFSLAKENAKLATTKQRVLYGSCGAAVAVVVLLLVVSRRMVLLPLQRLQAGAKQLERGETAAFDIRSADEVGELAAALTQMASAIHEREDEVRGRNRDLRLVLDNVGQGFLRLDERGVMSDEYSRVVETWFGKPRSGDSFVEHVVRIDPGFAAWFEAAFAQLVEGILPAELTLAQFPMRLAHAGQTWSLEYRLISSSDERFDGLVVVISDVTRLLEETAAQREQQEVIAALTRMTRDAHGYMQFLKEGESLIAALERCGADDDGATFRHVHTLKGICSVMEVHSLVGVCHELEEHRLEASRVEVEQARRLRQLWTHYLERVRPLVASIDDRSVVIEQERYLQFLHELETGAARRELLAEARAWSFDAAEKLLERLGEHARQLAGRLDKGEIVVEIDASDVRIPRGACSVLWSALIHAVRNAVDHGIEPAGEREARGKPARGTLRLSTSWDGADLAISVSDDGRGIDWSAVADRARQLGLPTATPADLERALFTERLTTRAAATEVSGRGVGTTAIRETVTNLGGRIELESARGTGTTFRILIPRKRIFNSERLQQPPDARRATAADAAVEPPTTPTTA